MNLASTFFISLLPLVITQSYITQKFQFNTRISRFEKSNLLDNLLEKKSK